MFSQQFSMQGGIASVQAIKTFEFISNTVSETYSQEGHIIYSVAFNAQFNIQDSIFEN